MNKDKKTNTNGIQMKIPFREYPMQPEIFKSVNKDNKNEKSDEYYINEGALPECLRCIRSEEFRLRFFMSNETDCMCSIDKKKSS